jgi:N-acetylated-alpha-linked acidic dipeptidase
MKTIISNCILSLFLGTIIHAQTDLNPSKDAEERQQKIEKQYDEILNPSNLDKWMKKLSARPHHVGSAYGKENAEFIRDLFRSWGFKAEIETY